MDKILKVTDEQIKWFKQNYGIVEYKIKESNVIDLNYFYFYVFGTNKTIKRFDEYVNPTRDEFIEYYVTNKNELLFIVDCLEYALIDSNNLEYFELSNNLNLLVKSVKKMIYLKNNVNRIFYNE